MGNQGTDTKAFIEALLVLLFAFLYPISTSLVYTIGIGTKPLNLTDVGSVALMGFELGVVGMFLLYWKARGSKLNELGISIGEIDILYTVLLFIAIYILPWAQYTLWVLFTRTAPSQSGFELVGHLSPFSVLLMSIVNPIYEELFLVGYVYSQLSKNTHWAFIALLSTLVRVSYHTYQGWYSVIGVGLYGLVMATFYWKFRRLAPVVIAHGLLDVYTLGQLMSP